MMNNEPGSAHLPYQLLENPTYILPDIIMKEELLDVEDDLKTAVNLGNPGQIVSVPSIKQELHTFEDSLYQPVKFESTTEVLPIRAVTEDVLELLHFKEEPDNLHDLDVSGDDTNVCNTDNKELNLGDGSAKALMSLCEEETVSNNTVTGHHNTASPDSEMQPSLSVTPSTRYDSNVSSVHHYSRDTVQKRMCTKGKISTIQRQEMQTRFKETITRNTPYNLTTNIGIPSDYKPFSCDTCHTCFSKISQLKTHTRIHRRCKQYICGTCHKSFSKLCNLKAHIIIHTGIKPYTCDTCDKRFNSLANLKTHTKRHTPEYTCDICQKSFSRLSSLQTHSKIYTGSKHYSCFTCPKSFSYHLTCKNIPEYTVGGNHTLVIRVINVSVTHLP